MLSLDQKTKIRRAFKARTLKVKSLSPRGVVQWKPITQVHRANTAHEDILRVHTDKGSLVLTGNHRIYLDPTTKVEASTLTPRQAVQTVHGNLPLLRRVVSVETLPSREFMYDLTVRDNHNLYLPNSGIIVSNCPDRNYKFRPPTSEGTINKYNRVFSYIWTDEELIEYMERGVDYINLWPPETGYNTIDQMIQAKPAWRQMILQAAISHATMALAMNWVEEEFSVVGETELVVYLSDETPVEISIEDLYELHNTEVSESRLTLSSELQQKLKDEIQNKTLRVQSVNPSTGDVRLSQVSDVMKHTTPDKAIHKITDEEGRQVSCTGDHSLFKYERDGSFSEVPASSLKAGDLTVVHDPKSPVIRGSLVTSNVETISRPFTYDLSVPGDENFILSNGILAHNSYSIGGVSLDIDKSSKYSSLQSTAEAQLDKMLEAKTRTTKIIRGLQQSRFGVGLRSRLGPNLGNGVQSPRNYIGIHGGI